MPSSPDVRGRYVVSPIANPQTALPFIQTIELRDGENVLATATWFTTGNDGVIQLLDARVVEGLRRQGVGTGLFKQVQREADRFLRTRNSSLRRVVCHAEQKSHIVARAWLTKLGFHHVQTIGNTMKNEDTLIYVLGCD